MAAHHVPVYAVVFSLVPPLPKSAARAHGIENAAPKRTGQRNLERWDGPRPTSKKMVFIDELRASEIVAPSRHAVVYCVSA